MCTGSSMCLSRFSVQQFSPSHQLSLMNCLRLAKFSHCLSFEWANRRNLRLDTTGRELPSSYLGEGQPLSLAAYTRNSVQMAVTFAAAMQLYAPGPSYFHSQVHLCVEVVDSSCAVISTFNLFGKQRWRDVQ